MRRDLRRLSDETFDVLIIGGGIFGAAIARDAARRGLKTALVEKNDFAAATSAHNSRLVHGGLRYLRNFEIGLVREALLERRIWLAIAPHLVRPLPFLLPVMSTKDRLTFSAGLSLYDTLARVPDDDEGQLPRHQWVKREEVVAREPILDRPDLKGAFLYYDAQMISPERLALECLIDADAHGAALANHVEAERLLEIGGRIAGAAVRDGLSNTPFGIRATETVVAAGPWTDLFLAHALQKGSPLALNRSKGIHLVVPSQSRLAITMKADRGHFFILPWLGHTLLGTTDTPYRDDLDQVDVTADERDEFLGLIARHLPASRISTGDVENAYAGVRPLIGEGSRGTYRASRRAEIIDHARDGTAGLISVIGGKWTTARHVARRAVDHIVGALAKKAPPCTTDGALPGAIDPDEMAKRVPPQLAKNAGYLAQLYGRRLPQVLALAAENPALAEPIGPAGDIAAQVIHAVRHEMAMTAEDVIMRRTGIGLLRGPDDATGSRVEALMAAAR